MQRTFEDVPFILSTFKQQFLCFLPTALENILLHLLFEGCDNLHCILHTLNKYYFNEND